MTLSRVPSGPGLCVSCARVRVLKNRRGSEFILCTRSKDDPEFPRYPRLPVLECPGYEGDGSVSALS